MIKKWLVNCSTNLVLAYEERPGGYIRILKCGFRTGDKAPMAYVELIDRPEVEEVVEIEETEAE